MLFLNFCAIIKSVKKIIFKKTKPWEKTEMPKRMLKRKHPKQ